MKRGVSPAKVEALENWRESNLFDRREQTVLEYAEAMTRSDLRVDDELVERLRAYFDDDGIVELTASSRSRICRASSTAPWGYRPRDSAGCTTPRRREDEDAPTRSAGWRP